MSEFDDTSSNIKSKSKTDLDIELADNPQKIPPVLKTESSILDSEEIKFQTDEEEILVKRKKRGRNQKSYIFFTSILTSIIWVAGSLFYLMDQNALGQNTLDQIGMILAILGPAAFSLLAGLLGEALVKSGRDARIFSATAKRLLEPPEGIEDSSLSRLKIVREEIGRLERALDFVSQKLGGIDDKISQKTRELVEVSASAKSGADNLVSSLEEERKRLASILDGLSELSKTTANTTKIATQSINENAEILGKAAQGLAEKSDLATSQAAMAANKLEEAMAKTMGVVSGLDEASLRGEQALARAHELLVLARVRSDDAVGGVSNAIEYLHAAAQNAAEMAQNVSQLVANETQNSRALSIKTIEDVRTIAEDSANQIMQALRAEAENARIRAKEAVESFDQTNNAIRILTEDAAQRASAQFETIRQENFEITANADKLVEKSVTNAKELINASATILDETGERIKARFSELARTSIDQARAIEDIIAGLNDKLAQLPKEADERAKAIEIALEQTLSNLNQAGVKAADEVRSLDNAFQTRLRASYDALGDVVGKLGSIPGIAPGLETPKQDPDIKAVAQDIDYIQDPRRIVRDTNESEIAVPRREIEPPPPKPVEVEPVKPIIEPPKPQVEISAPVALEKPEAAKEIPEPVVPPKIVFDTKPIFASVLSPQIPVRSASITTPVPKIEPSPKPDFSLRGTIDEAEAKKNIEPTPEKIEPPIQKAPDFSTPQKPNAVSDNIDFENPFGDFKLRGSIQSGESPNNWTWRDVLKSLDDSAPKSHDELMEKLLGDHNLRHILNAVVLERFAQNYIRDFEKARNQIKLALPNQIRVLQKQMGDNAQMRSQLVKFVESRRESVRHNRLKDDELRLYLFADAALAL